MQLIEDHFKKPNNAGGEDDELNDRDGWNKVEVEIDDDPQVPLNTDLDKQGDTIESINNS